LEHSVDTGQALLVWPAAEQAQADRYLENASPSTAAGEQPSPKTSEAAGEGWPLRLQIPLLGQHQVENAATAFSALQVFGQQALPVSRAAILQGFARVAWPGRFEILQRCPPVVLDCAHNRDSALKLRLALDDYFPGLPVILVFGASEDKDIEGMFVELLPRVEQVIATRSFHPRAIDPEKLVALAHRDGRPARVIEKVEEALPEAIRLAGQEALVLVTGSIFVAAAARDSWYNDIKL
jgi:dihydrofolate synthase/folylpolyglutamate synthase